MKTATKHHGHLPLEDRDRVTIHNELATVVADLTTVTTMGGIILEHVDLGGSRKVMQLKRERLKGRLGFFVVSSQK